MAGQILVVEDDHAVRAVFARALRNEGHDIDEAADGDAALEKIRTADYRVLLLDLRLPKKSGFDVLSALHQERPPAHSRFPIVLILSSSPDDMRHVPPDPRVMLSINKTFALQNLDPVIAAISAVAELA